MSIIPDPSNSNYAIGDEGKLYTALRWLPAVADIAAPTIAEINAASTVAWIESVTFGITDGDPEKP